LTTCWSYSKLQIYSLSCELGFHIQEVSFEPAKEKLTFKKEKEEKNFKFLDYLPETKID